MSWQKHDDFYEPLSKIFQIFNGLSQPYGPCEIMFNSESILTDLDM